MSVHVDKHISCETVQAAGRRPYRRYPNNTCCVCRERPRRAKQRDCKECHAATMRDWRLKRKEELERLRALAKDNGVRE